MAALAKAWLSNTAAKFFLKERKCFMQVFCTSLNGNTSSVWSTVTKMRCLLDKWEDKFIQYFLKFSVWWWRWFWRWRHHWWRYEDTKAKYPFFKWRRRHLRIFEIFFFYLKIRNISNTFMELIIDFPGISRKGCTYIDSVLSCVVFVHIWQLCGLKVVIWYKITSAVVFCQNPLMGILDII